METVSGSSTNAARALQTQAGEKLLELLASQPSVPSTPRVILDTDVGGDDAFAFLWLFALCTKGHCQLEGITTVGGNVRAQRAFTNICLLLSLFPEIGCVTVAAPPKEATGGEAGAGTGGASHIHGKDGIGGLSKRLCNTGGLDFAHALESSEFIEDRLIRNPHAITLLCIGPLTNLATLERRRPGILRLAREVIWMGGSFKGGNITPLAEFNCYCDPDAVKLVLDRVELVMLPLDITEDLVLTRDILANLTEDITTGVKTITENDMDEQTPYSSDAKGRREFLIDLAKFMWGSNMAFRATSGKVSCDEHTYGLTFMDKRHVIKSGRMNAWVALKVDAVEGLAAGIEDLRHII